MGNTCKAQVLVSSHEMSPYCDDLHFVYIESCYLLPLFLYSECPNLRVPHAEIKGNMHHEGTKRKVICNANSGYETSAISSCRNGTWTNIPICRIGMAIKSCYGFVKSTLQTCKILTVNRRTWFVMCFIMFNL